MDYTPYYDTMRRTSLLRGMTDAELDTLMACFAPRVRRYAKGELLLMAGYETHEVGLVLEGAITASKPLADGSTVVMARMGPGGVFADVLAGGRSRSPSMSPPPRPVWHCIFPARHCCAPAPRCTAHT